MPETQPWRAKVTWGRHSTAGRARARGEVGQRARRGQRRARRQGRAAGISVFSRPAADPSGGRLAVGADHPALLRSARKPGLAAEPAWTLRPASVVNQVTWWHERVPWECLPPPKFAVGAPMHPARTPANFATISMSLARPQSPPPQTDPPTPEPRRAGQMRAGRSAPQQSRMADAGRSTQTTWRNCCRGVGTQTLCTSAFCLLPLTGLVEPASARGCLVMSDVSRRSLPSSQVHASSHVRGDVRVRAGMPWRACSSGRAAMSGRARGCQSARGEVRGARRCQGVRGDVRVREGRSECMHPRRPAERAGMSGRARGCQSARVGCLCTSAFCP
jgi:hypothetical protein